MQPRQLLYVLSAFCFGALIAVWLYALENAPKNPRVQTIGKSLIGGSFTLTDQNGETVSSSDYKGKFMLIYFGYSFCPDICPTDLQKMSTALELIGNDASKVQPIFISIDPDRDTPEQLKSYISNFHPSLVGLTGTPEQINAVKKKYKVYGIKVDSEGKPSKNITGDDYLMDHSPQTYLMGPNGEFITYYKFSTSAKQMAKSIVTSLKTLKISSK